jgi:hypothetical protein
MLRIRDLIDKLNLANVSVEASRLNNNLKESALNGSTSGLGNTQILQLTPNPILTPIAPSNLSGMSTPSMSFTPTLTPFANNLNSHQAYLLNEHRERLVKKAWGIFEYSVCVDNCATLMKNRHIDQLIMCAVYLTCRLNSLPVQFRDIMMSYKLIMTTITDTAAKARVYRKVFINQDNLEGSEGDLIRFYNEIYLKKLKPYADILSEKGSVMNPSASGVAALISLTPKARMMSACSSYQYHQFTPRRVSSCDTQAVFVTPSRGHHSIQIVPPTMHNRNKFLFSLNDVNIIKVIIDFMINLYLSCLKILKVSLSFKNYRVLTVYVCF